MSKPVGGRGVKAPYTTTHIRIPEDLKAEFEARIESYRENLLTGKDGDTVEKSLTSLPEAIEAAKLLVRSKKSARQSMARLLTAIYGTPVSFDDLAV